MSIIKFEFSIPEVVQAVSRFHENRLRALESVAHEVRASLGNIFNQLLDTEMALFIGKADQFGNKRNGYLEKDYTLKGLGTIRIRVPRDREGNFKSIIIPKNERMDPQLKADMAILHLAGLSTRVISLVSKRLLGLNISKDLVTSSLDLISPKAIEWLTRPITETYWALYIDGTNFNIQRRGSTEKEPSLVVLGIDQHGYRSILAIEPGTKDNADSWRAVFASLKQRGLDFSKVQIGIMDGLPGLENAFREFFPKAVTARCWVHALKNVLAKTPARLRGAFKILTDKIMYAQSEKDARLAFEELKQTMGKDAQRAVGCLEKDIDSLLVHYRFEKSYWRTLRTTNPIERVNKELKRRIKSMGTVGEATLEAMLAFIALRLEVNWRRGKVNEKKLDNLKNMGENVIDFAFSTLSS